MKVKLKSLSRVRLFATPWIVAYQASPSMGFSRQEYWSGLPFWLQSPSGVIMEPPKIQSATVFPYHLPCITIATTEAIGARLLFLDSALI